MTRAVAPCPVCRKRLVLRGDGRMRLHRVDRRRRCAGSGKELPTATDAGRVVGDVVALAQLVLRFGRVDRVTFHEDGRTPESDTDHTVMLGVVACAFAERFAPHLDLGLIAQLALVHDLVEAKCGDTNTLGITPEGRAAKATREREALEEIRREFDALPWLARTIERYEALSDPEARFVKVLDKVLPKLTHALNGGATLRAHGVDLAGLREVNGSQREAIAHTYGADQEAAVALLFAAHEELVRRLSEEP